MSFGSLVDSFTAVVARIDLEVQVGKDYLEWFKRRSRAEIDYAKGIAEYCHAPPGNSKAPAVLKIERTMRESLVCLTETGIKTAERHAQCAKKIGDDIAKPLEAFLKQTENEKKRLQNEGEKKLKALKDLQTAAGKARENVEKLAKEAEAAREAHAKAVRDAAAAPDNKKLPAAIPKAEANKKQREEKAAAADAAYATAVRTHNEAQQKLYSDEMPKLMTEYQKLFEDMFRAIEKALQTYLDALKPFAESYTEVCGVIEQKVTKEISFDTDLKELVDAIATGKNPINPIDYVPFGGGPVPKSPEDEPGALKPAEAPAAAPVAAAPAAVEAAPAPATTEPAQQAPAETAAPAEGSASATEGSAQ